MNTAIVCALAVAFCGAALAADELDLKKQVNEASLLADGMKIAVGEFVNENNRLPASNEEAGLPAPALIRGRYVASGRIEGSRIIFEFGPGAHESLVSKHVFFEGKLEREGGRFLSLMWFCRSEDIAQEACPKSCACSGS
jgi:hypothetical protein